MYRISLLIAILLSGCSATFLMSQQDQAKPSQSLHAVLHIIDKPIDFGKRRIALTKTYIRNHYGKTVDSITIVPKIILLHYTAIDSFEESYNTMRPEMLGGSRNDIAKASALNVSVQFLVDKNGTIYQLMPETQMGRHVIGLNYYAIGVENVAKDAHSLTPAQVKANIALVKYLKTKYPTIKYLVGHHEYRRMEQTKLWLEKDKGYRTIKYDPGEIFMQKVRAGVRNLNLKMPPKSY
ncbi:MAG: peptidoglycan recognition protein family protein [Sulfurovum sp.]|nr:peptidoglycan recognition protein family protein [Sulfurovum sp.]MCB4746441.1 peptidoglycan recognition protein family protein [Sulfurovum sp.]MCB4749483.1 peptidoglycan recognition protein family protein [Sulfurovum sp.]MCB4755043.1 peptidoglycan recognition protein family protein [Sulfurovum sp.]MCB4758208.1 peptidoglycan recognition protein family protein [Sulfurovum sp.]